MNSWASRLEALLARERRVILGITGSPGAGKTAMASQIASTIDDAVHIPMDGFHLADVQLQRLGRLDRKGAIDTFDAYGYLALLQRIRRQDTEIVYAPAFDRDIEQPVAGSIRRRTDGAAHRHRGKLSAGRRRSRGPTCGATLDEVWFVDLATEERRRRLIARHIEFGKSPEQAQAWVRAVDDPNAERIERVRHKADLVV